MSYSILINGKGRVNCRDPGYLTDMVPTSLKSVLQGMNYTVKGYFGPGKTLVMVTDWKLKMRSTSKHLCPNNVFAQL
ncbi:uncharacterized protein ACHE_70280S [Aspergillus chevalieri]|uniref:Uncharacterized protein n=1 Tax=Aspergillus chevalieri TaxID=182096 RepID=A0A7R7VV89_ASPCH|nr:uncharacterized protein ACHE_70280S [Aspergillus chevalieri]BCR91437.1 hypothetical protein ACHE_70280S [Aspergillus chevalieri]